MWSQAKEKCTAPLHGGHSAELEENFCCAFERIRTGINFQGFQPSFLYLVIHMFFKHRISEVKGALFAFFRSPPLARVNPNCLLNWWA